MGSAFIAVRDAVAPAARGPACAEAMICLGLLFLHRTDGVLEEQCEQARRRVQEAEDAYRAVPAAGPANPAAYHFFANFLDQLSRPWEAQEMRAEEKRLTAKTFPGA